MFEIYQIYRHNANITVYKLAKMLMWHLFCSGATEWQTGWRQMI